MPPPNGRHLPLPIPPLAQVWLGTWPTYETCPLRKQNPFTAHRMREEKLNYNLCLIIQNLPFTQSKRAKFWKIVICSITVTYRFCNYSGGKDLLDEGHQWRPINLLRKNT